MPYKKLSRHIYLVGGKTLSHPSDCNVYLIDGRPAECVLIDSGCGLNTLKILKNIEKAGFNPGRVSAVINTHCHYCHAGGNRKLNKYLGYIETIIHELDATAVENGDNILTGANLHKGVFEPCQVNVRVFTSDTELMKFLGFGDKLWITAGSINLSTIHLPGHTPGSMGLYGIIDGLRILFAGDIDGPFRREWNSNIVTWYNSINSLLMLKIDRIYLGHKIIAEGIKDWLVTTLRNAPSVFKEGKF
jgi:glyoxylase-like metal-dependent hydrolase (beta-lactamase superfamily II)